MMKTLQVFSTFE